MVLCVVPLLMVLLGCVSGGTAAAETNSPGMDLDAAIREAASHMEARLPGGTEVALVSVASSSAQFSEYVIGRLEAAIVGSGKLVVVDRANLDKVRAERGFQLSGEVDDNSAKDIGKIVGAGAIVTGSFTNLGDVYSLTLKAINIETATVAVSYPADITKSTRIETLLASGGGAGSARTAPAQTARAGTTGGGTAAPTPAPAQAAPAKVYKVGDTGPAGGIVFFDMGFVINGWRYLEAAPRDFQIAVRWGPNGSVGATQTIIGGGKQNTELMISTHGNETLGAAQMATADAATYSGYDDWFLPSRDDLNLLYTNLKAKSLGSFGSGWYWSSSEVDGDSAWVQRFSDGAQSYGGDYNYNKSSAYSVRAIRRF
jgi:hypothetical protein